MNTRHIARVLLVLWLGLGSHTGQAEDIDVYVGGEDTTGAAANVLIVLDNTSNFSNENEKLLDASGNVVTNGYAEAAALITALQSVDNGVNIGLMMYGGPFKDDDGFKDGSTSDSGGYPIFAIREKATAGATLGALIAKIQANVGDEAYKGPTSASYADLSNSIFRYFNGLHAFNDVDSGVNTRTGGNDFRDWPGNTQPTLTGVTLRSALAGSGYTTAATPDSYTTTARTHLAPPEANGGCAKNFVIFVGNAYPSKDTDVTTATTRINAAAAELQAKLTAAGLTMPVTPDLTAIATATSLTQFAPYWMRFMYDYGVPSLVDDPASTTTPKARLWNRITTYTVDVCNQGCDSNDGPKQGELLKSMASNGGGKYYRSKSLAQLEQDFKAIFAEIQSVNSAFASATLPISVNTQGTFENQVYIGVFRPDGSSGPRWMGNLKGYKFGRYCDFDGKVWDGTKLVSTSSENSVLVDPLRTQPISGTYTSSDERIADDVLLATCGYYKDASENNVEKISVKLYLADKYGYPAISQKLLTGFFDDKATSFWTTDSGTYWQFKPARGQNDSDLPDGGLVERGAAAQRLRAKWAEAPVSPYPDGRKMFTCLSDCLGSAKPVSLTAFYDDSGTVTTALPKAPTVPVNISAMSRTGNVVSVTTSTDHGLSAGSSINITGATPTAYAGSKVVTEVSDTTHFKYSVAETPAQNDGGSVSATDFGDFGVSSVVIAGPSLSGGAVVATATLTMSGTGNGTYTSASTPTIEGANQSFVNGGPKTITKIDSTSFTYGVTVSPAETTYATRKTAGLTGTVKSGTDTTALTITEAYYLTTGKAVIKLATAINSNGQYAINKVAAITSAPAPYTKAGQLSSSWTVAGRGVDCDSDIPTAGSDKNFWFCVTLANDQLYASTDPGTTILAKFPSGTAYPLTIVRTPGSDTALATIGTSHTGLAGITSVFVAGTSDYNGTWTISATDITSNSDTSFSLVIGVGQPVTARGPVQPTLSSAQATPELAHPETADLIAWIRGKDVWEDENLNGSKADVRASIHGDVLHARPAVVNYGSDATYGGIFAFYGSNEGLLRGVKVGTDDTKGEELWSFIPEEFVDYAKMERLYLAKPKIRYPSLSCNISPTPVARDYFWDGPIAVYQSPELDANKRPLKTWLFAGMRRGGHALYAFDVTDPATPKLKWRISNTKINSVDSTVFAKLGQTWSEPKIVNLKHLPATVGGPTETLALVFGGGYDETTEDVPTGAVRSEATSGYGVFVVNADTGALITHLLPPRDASTNPYRSVPADVTPVDTNADNYLDRIYAVDTGGNILRFDANTTRELGSPSPTSDYWASYRVAKLGDVAIDGGEDDRKLMQQPAAVRFTLADNRSGYNILVGSGNREKPLANRLPAATLANTRLGTDGGARALTCTTGSYYPDSYYYSTQVKDRFFGVMDFDQTDPDTYDTTPITESNLQPVNVNPSTLVKFDFTTSLKGWYVDLKYNPYQPTAFTWWEEKLVNSPKIEQGVVYFSTNTPQGADVNNGVCSNLGTALAYAIDPFTGLPAFNRDQTVDINGKRTYSANDYASKVAGGGLPPSVTSGTVKIGEEFYRASIGTGGTGKESKSAQEGERTDFSVPASKTSIYWLYGAD